MKFQPIKGAIAQKGKGTMNINILEDVKDNCHRAMYQEGLSQSNKEAYEILASQFNRLLNTVEEQASILRSMAALSEETGNYNLAEAIQSLCSMLNPEYDLLDESKRACNYVAYN